jgi:hypothetical protein
MFIYSCNILIHLLGKLPSSSRTVATTTCFTHLQCFPHLHWRLTLALCGMPLCRSFHCLKTRAARSPLSFWPCVCLCFYPVCVSLTPSVFMLCVSAVWQSVRPPIDHARVAKGVCVSSTWNGWQHAMTCRVRCKSDQMKWSSMWYDVVRQVCVCRACEMAGSMLTWCVRCNSGQMKWSSVWYDVVRQVCVCVSVSSMWNNVITHTSFYIHTHIDSPRTSFYIHTHTDSPHTSFYIHTHIDSPHTSFYTHTHIDSLHTSFCIHTHTDSPRTSFYIHTHIESPRTSCVKLRRMDGWSLSLELSWFSMKTCR